MYNKKKCKHKYMAYGKGKKKCKYCGIVITNKKYKDAKFDGGLTTAIKVSKKRDTKFDGGLTELRY